MTSFMAGSLSEQFPRSRDNFVRAEPEFSQQIFQRRGGAETMHTNHLSFCASVALPTKGGGHLHGNARGDTWWKHALLVSSILPLEQFPGRHAHDSGLDAIDLEFFISFHAKRQFASAGHYNDVRLP